MKSKLTTKERSRQNAQKPTSRTKTQERIADKTPPPKQVPFEDKDNQIQVLKLKLESLEQEKTNWLLFQEYFEKQLARFMQFTSTNNESFCIDCNQKTAQPTGRITPNKTRDLTPQQSGKFSVSQVEIPQESRSGGFTTRDRTPESKDNTIMYLNNVKMQLEHLFNMEQTQITPQKSHRRTPSKDQEWRKEKVLKIVEQMAVYVQEANNRMDYQQQQTQQNEQAQIRRLKAEIEILEKQILILLKDKDSKQNFTSGDSSQEKNLQSLLRRQNCKLLKLQEENQIHQLTIEIMSKQLEQQNQLIKIQEKEKERIEEIFEGFQQQLQEQTQKATEAQAQVTQMQQELQKRSSKLLKVQVVQDQKKKSIMPSPPPTIPTALITQVSPPDSDGEERKGSIHSSVSRKPQLIMQHLEAQIIEQRIINSKLEKLREKFQAENSFLKQDIQRVIQEKEKIQKSYIEQIQSLQSEKEQQCDQYINQINALQMKLNDIEEEQKAMNDLRQQMKRQSKELMSLTAEIERYRQIEAEFKSKAQPVIRRESMKNQSLEIHFLKDQLSQALNQVDQQHSDHQKLMKVSLEKEQLASEVAELTRQLREKKPASTAPSNDNTLPDEIEKIYQANKSKMIHMKSKLMGLKMNLEKHGENLGVQHKSKQTPQEMAQEAQNQQAMVMDELCKLIDHMNDLQRAIDTDYGNKFTKINERQRVLIAQNFQLKAQAKKYDGWEEQMKEKDRQLEHSKMELRQLELEYKEYKDIMQTKFQDAQKGLIVSVDVSENDRQETIRQKEIERLQMVIKEQEIKIGMLKQDIQTAGQQMQMMSHIAPSDTLHVQMDDHTVRSAARTIQQHSLDMKQSDILNKKINSLSDQLSQKILEAQRYHQENQTLNNKLKQEKQEWLAQLEKRDKQFKQLEEKYKKCLEQFEKLQQQNFALESKLVPPSMSHSRMNSDSD